MRRIRTKLFLSLMIVMIAYTAVGIVLNLCFLRPYYVQQNQAEFARMAAQIQALDAPQDLEQQLQEMGHDNGLFLAVTDAQFQILYASNALQNQLLPPEVIGAILQSGEDRTTVYTVSDAASAPSKLVYMQWLTPNRRIVLTKAISVVEESVSIANRFYIVTGAMMCFLGSIAVFFFSRTLTRPIVQMSQTAQRMAQLRFDQTVEVSTQDELGSLAQSINTLSVKLKKTMEQLQKDIDAQKMLSRNLSHQLKTPVAVIKGHAEGLIYRVVESAEDQRAYLNVIVHECDRMDGLVKEMLLLSKVTVYGKEAMRMERVDVARLYTQLQTRFSQQFREKKMVFSQHVAQGAAIHANPDLLEHAMANYIDNAIQYGSGEIAVNFEKLKDCGRFSVFNTGKPIAEAELQHIFEPFCQLNYARKEQDAGHGLGLAIVRAIAEAHGGNAYAQNQENGVTFFLEIPCA